jgi:hypothetical protein
MTTCNDLFKTVCANCDASVGGYLVETPDIINANVTRTRGNPVTSAAITFHYKGKFSVPTGAGLIIRFYKTVVFTGFIKSFSVSPSFRCAGDTIIKIQGEDILFKLQNQNITRRQKLTGLGIIAFITGVQRKVDLGFDDPDGLNRYAVSHSSSPTEIMTPTTNTRAQDQWLGSWDSPMGPNHPITKIADPIPESPGRGGSEAGLIIHDHSDMENLGPAVAVFGTK